MKELNHLVTNKALENIKEVMIEQDYKGHEKYGVELDAKDNYNWNRMADEELADYLKYRQCEREDKQRAIEWIERGIEQDSMLFVKKGLNILNK